MLLKVLFSLVLWVDLVLSAAVNTTLPGKWTPLAPIANYQRQEHTTVTTDSNTIYVLGGILPELDGVQYPTVTYVQKYTISSNSWVSVAPMPVALNHANAAAVNGKIYVLGGLTPQNGIWNATGVSFMYDPSTNIWTSLGRMPEGRQIGSAAVGVLDTTIYLAGGLTLTNLTVDEELTVAYFTSYNIQTQKWAVLPDMPAPRDHAGVGLVNEIFYVLGGRSFGHWNVVDTVFSYDIMSDCWDSGLAVMPTGRGGCASAIIGDLIFTIGGEGDPKTTTNVFPENQAYDTSSNTWIKYANMDTPRHGTSAVAIMNNIYIPGGGIMIGGDPTDYFSYFTPSF